MFRDYFYFPKKERRLLIVLIVLLIAALNYYHYLRSLAPSLPFSPSKLNAALLQLDSIERVEEKRKRPILEAKVFSFNPNTIDSIAWIKLGMSPKQIKSIFKYKASGAVFKQKSDLLKLYVVDSSWYQKVYDSILLPIKITKSKNESSLARKPKRILRKIELNKSDSLDWMQLPGIGPVYTKRILAYRKKLGAYYSKQQLTEVYGMDEEKLAVIDTFLLCCDSIDRKLKLNTMAAKDLVKHPYIDWNTANAIVKYRKQNGNYKTIDDLKKIYLINDSLLFRLKHYVDFD